MPFATKFAIPIIFANNGIAGVVGEIATAKIFAVPDIEAVLTNDNPAVRFALPIILLSKSVGLTTVPVELSEPMPTIDDCNCVDRKAAKFAIPVIDAEPGIITDATEVRLAMPVNDALR